MTRPLDAAAVRSLVGHLRRCAGSVVRGAAWYTEGEYEITYLRPDVEAIYSPDETSEVVGDLIFEAFGDPQRLGSLYHLGDLNATVRWFDEGFVVHFPCGDGRGAAVSFDHGGAAEPGTVVAVGSAFLEAYRA